MNWTITLLRAMLLFVLATQVLHQRISIGDPTLMNFFMAVTIEVGISVIASAVFTIVMGSDKPSRLFALAALPALYWMMLVSFEASVSVFHKNKLDQVNSESKTLASKLSEGKAIVAHNAMLKLTEQGITSGEAYDNVSQQLDAGLALMQENEANQKVSTTALAMTGGDASENAANDKALDMAKQRAIMLIVLTLALSGLSGLWSGITTGWTVLRSQGVTARPKHQGSRSATP